MVLMSPLLILTPLLIYFPLSSSQKANYHIGYREVNWCVTGKDEPELHEWPFNQFVHLLRKTNRMKHDSHVRYDLRFYDIITKQKDLGHDGRLFKTMHVAFMAEEKDKPTENAHEVWKPMEIEGLIIQANSNPYTLGLPTGQFFDAGAYHKDNSSAYENAEINCLDCKPEWWARSITCRKRAKIHVEHPTILAWHHEQRTFDLKYDPTSTAPVTADTPEATPKKQTQVHSNFRFYSPKCSPVRRMMFTVLVVRSFTKHEYDLFALGPYQVTVRGQHFQSDIHPSPYFLVFTQRSICHHLSASDITLEHPQKFPEFEMNHYFDCCLREEENKKSKDTIDLLKLKNTKSVSCYEKLYVKQKGKFDPKTIKIGDESWTCFFPFLPSPNKCNDDGAKFEDSLKAYSLCPPCRIPPTTTTLKPTPKGHTIYKRTAHGGLMIMTNFCLQPIVVYVARFYKETFNTSFYKGNKSWYWMHLLGGMVSSGMVYFGYFSGGISDHPLVKDHVLIGDVYIITLGICYITAWGRHKNLIITTIMEFIHGCMGYVTLLLALASIVSAPGMQFTSKLFVVMMAMTQGFFMIILTCQICLLDKKMGMKPKRRHFPTVEARFDEIKVPGAKFRVIMLMIFSTITFGLSTGSTFVD